MAKLDCTDRIFKGADNWLLVDVEACIHNAGKPCLFSVGFEDSIVARILPIRNNLRPSRPIHMHDAHACLPHPWRALEGNGHKSCRIFCALHCMEAFRGFLSYGGRGEGHELSPLEALIQPVVDGWIRRFVENGPVAQRPWPIFHRSIKPSDHAPLWQEIRDIFFYLATPPEGRLIRAQGHLRQAAA